MFRTSNPHPIFAIPLLYNQLGAKLGIVMQSKERMVHWVEEAGERLRLDYQPILHAIQVLNVLDHPRSATRIATLSHALPLAHALAAATLSLTYKLYHAQPIHMRDLTRAVGAEAAAAVLECQVIVMVELKWKLAMPLLYDEVIAVAHQWDKYSRTLAEFPLRFEGGQEGGNHNYLVRNVRVCLYNLSHLIRQASLEALSGRILRLAQAIFLATVKQLLREQRHSFVLPPTLSMAFLLADFFRRVLGVAVQEVSAEVVLVAEVLANYQHFRQQSKQRPIKQHRSNKHSEDKENVPYYVNRQKKRSKSKGKAEEHCGKLKSRSRSKAEGSRGKLAASRWEGDSAQLRSKDSAQLKSKDSLMVGVHKKSSSAKSMHPQRDEAVGKTGKFNKSKTSKRSEKSQFASKLPSCLDDPFTSKSTYWLKPAVKTDKKSANSIRMKLR